MGVACERGLVGGESFGDAAETKQGVAAIGAGGLVAEGFRLLEGEQGFFDEGEGGGWGGRGVFGEKQDAAGVGNLGTGMGGASAFGFAEGVPGLREVLLLEMEVGEGEVDFGEPVRVQFCQVEGAQIAGLSLQEAAVAAGEVAEIEVSGEFGGSRVRTAAESLARGLDCLAITGGGELVASVGDELDAEVEPGGGEAGAEGNGAAVGLDGVAVVAEFAESECLGEVAFGAVRGELGGVCEVSKGFRVVVLMGEGVTEAEVGGVKPGVEGKGAGKGGLCRGVVAEGE